MTQLNKEKRYSAAAEDDNENYNQINELNDEYLKVRNIRGDNSELCCDFFKLQQRLDAVEIWPIREFVCPIYNYYLR